MDDCPICAKHRGAGPLTGPLVWADDQVLVFHKPGPTVLGHLFVETRRHAPHLSDLTDDEAAVVGRAVSRAAAALTRELNAEHVFSAVIGIGVAHFHQHVIARHPGTPDAYGWFESHAWPAAPHGDPDDLCDRLRRRLSGAMTVTAGAADRTETRR